ncbi:MAG: O-antigen ligase family protein [Gemmataceae bacterium]|nr:O-antigen ligase family protein [Gemmataceae bacterium]
MSFVLFLLVNAALFIRPAEIVPALLGWRIYEVLIIACFVAALPEVVAYLMGRSLDTQPVTLCVFLLLGAVVLSHAGQLDAEKATETGYEFFKVVVYYLLLVSVVNTAARLRTFLFWTALFCTGMCLLAVLRYHDLVEIHLPPPPLTAEERAKGVVEDVNPESARQKQGAAVKDAYFDPATGALVEVRRLRGTGIFQDPNDICLAVAIAVPLCLFWLTDRRLGGARLLWLVPLAVLFYTLYLTHSRGGLLGVLVGLGVVFQARYGWRLTLAVAVPVVAGVIVALAGRLTNIDGGGTGQSRIELWSEGLQMLRSAPLFGVGMNEFGKHASHVAHNSFIHCFAELGLFGGTLFLGAFFCAVVSLRRSGTRKAPLAGLEMARLQPYLMAVLGGSAVCMLTLSLSYIVPTYMVLGLVTVYLGVAVVRVAQPVLRCDIQLLGRLAVVSVAFVAASYVFVNVMVRW